MVNEFTGWFVVSGMTDLVVSGMLWLEQNHADLGGKSKMVTFKVPG